MPPPNPRHKRTAAQRAADAVLIEKWLLQGHTHANIAAMLSHQRDYTLTRQQVSLDAAKLMEWWKTEVMRDFDVAFTRQLMALDMQEAELWEAWDKSKKRSPGNIAYMRALLEVHDLRARLLGFYAPVPGQVSRGGSQRFPATPPPVVRVVFKNGTQELPAGELPLASSCAVIGKAPFPAHPCLPLPLCAVVSWAATTPADDSTRPPHHSATAA